MHKIKLMSDETYETILARAESLEEFKRDLVIGLIRLRKQHGLTQEVVGERMGVSQSAVSQFERYDSNPTLATLCEYALSVGARLEAKVVDDCCRP